MNVNLLKILIISTLWTQDLGAAWAWMNTDFGLFCRFKECCTERWIPNNFTDLKVNLNKYLYGQHLVTGPVIKHLKGHNENPRKALALSFHGWPGLGKTFTSKLVAESLYKEGLKSKYVHLISAIKEFPHEDMVSQYKDELRERIESAVKSCPQSLFIIEEMHKMPAGLIDTIIPYIEFHEDLAGEDYRKSIFLFISNTAGSDISKYTVQHLRQSRERESIQLKVMEDIIKSKVFDSEGQGFWRTELITEDLITAFIPFLPLDHTHVKQCIKQDMIERGYLKEGDMTNELGYCIERATSKHGHCIEGDTISEAEVREILDQLNYYPDDLKLYSTTGCKRVHEKVDLIVKRS